MTHRTRPGRPAVISPQEDPVQLVTEDNITDLAAERWGTATDPRTAELMTALVRHLHDFAREVKLTEEEFQAACVYIVAIGKHSNETHNEAVLMSGSLGLSALICLLNNGEGGALDTDANLLGPFWRMHSPKTPNGGSIVRSPTPGPAMFVKAWFQDRDGKPVVGAEVDV